MIEIAIHTPSRHLQAVLASPGVVVFRPPGGDWALKQLPAEGLRAPHFELVNLGDQVFLRTTLDAAGVTAQGRPVGADGKRPLALPVRFVVGDTRVEVAKRQRSDTGGAGQKLIETIADEAQPVCSGLTTAALARWSEALATLSRWPVDQSDFFRSVASLVVDPIGLDGAFVLTRCDAISSRWDVAAAALPMAEQRVWFNQSMLDHAFETGEAYLWSAGDGEHSLARTYVVAPWRNQHGRVVGAVVGMRKSRSSIGQSLIRMRESNLVRVFAKTIEGIRLRGERDAYSTRRRVLLEQAFVPEVAAKIEADPHIHRGSVREVSLLFADLRDASRIFHSGARGNGDLEPLIPTEAFDLLRDFLSAMADEVLRRSGTVFDYYGDGLAAMWNAPVDQPEHARLACEAGLAVIDATKKICRAWQPRLGWEPRIAIGVHTGSAMVGNMGSRLKMKYAARGVAVDLASRVERASKRIDVPMLVTQTTANRLPEGFLTQRVYRAQMVGMDHGVSLYSVRRSDQPGWPGLDSPTYSEALALFEANRLDAAMRCLQRTHGAALVGPAAFLANEIQRTREERRRMLRSA